MKKITKLSAYILAIVAFVIPTLFVNAKVLDVEDIVALTEFEAGGQTQTKDIYFFGKVAFVGSFKTSDIVYASRFLDLEANPKPVLYYITTEKTTDPTTGDIETAVVVYNQYEEVAEDASKTALEIQNLDILELYDASNNIEKAKENATEDTEAVDTYGYVSTKTERAGGLRFVDESAAVKIVNITKITGDVDVVEDGVKNVEKSDKHAYNMSALNVAFDDEEETLTLTENTPLVSYINKGNDDKEGRYFGLLVETDQAVTVEDVANNKVAITLTNYYDEVNYPYNIADIDITDAKEYGIKNGFVMWLSEPTHPLVETKVRSLTFKAKDAKDVVVPTTYTITYNAENVFLTAYESEKAVEITN